jgi:Uma2 family endonuclease
MGIPRIDLGPMTVDEFYLLTDARPDGEKWELIDGEAVLNAAPSDFHQLILKNIIVSLGTQERRASVPWSVIPGIGALVSNTSRPEPDVMILPKPFGRTDHLRRDTQDAIVLFEILSPSTASHDLKWKRAAYTSLPALTHYIVVAQDAVDVLVFARETGFSDQRFRSRDDAIRIPSLDILLSPGDIYYEIDFAQ